MNVSDVAYEIKDKLAKTKSDLRHLGIDPNDADGIAEVMVALNMMNTYNATGLAVVAGNQQTASPHQATPQFPETFGEWAKHYNLKSHFDRFLAIAVYQFERHGKSNFDTGTITEAYEKARWAKPKNMADVFAKAAAPDKLYFAEAENADAESGLKQWRITRTGYEYFNSLKMED